MFGGFGGPGFGGPGFGGPGFGGPGFGGPGFGGPGFGGPGFGGPGFGGPGFGGPGGKHGKHGLKRAAFVTAALLLDGPADAAQVVQRVTDATDGAFTPPQDVAELAIGLLAGRGVVTVDNGVATLTELGRNLLAWRGISSETAHAFLGRAAKFGGATSGNSGPPSGFTYVGMTDTSQGVAIPAESGLDEIYVTTDGGSTWQPSPITG